MLSSLKINEVNMKSQTNYNITQRGTDTIYYAIPMECDKYPSKLILKPMNVLAKRIKSHDVTLFNTTLCKECTLLKYTYAQ